MTSTAHAMRSHHASTNIRTRCAFALASTALLIASPALAGFKKISTTAVVNSIVDPIGAHGTQLGDILTVEAIFDDSTLTDITAAANAMFGGTTAGIRVASLAAPGAGFSINFRGDTYTQDISQGVDASGFGVAYPYVIYHGANFWGFDILVQRGDGFQLGLFSEAELSNGAPPIFVGGDTFCCMSGREAFFGSIDIDGAQIAAVPEPSSWAMMMVGVGMTGAVLRRRRGGSSRATEIPLLL